VPFAAKRILLAASLTAVLLACDRSAQVAERDLPSLHEPPGISDTAPAADLFAAVRTASSGAPRVFGSYTRGCISGARQLPLEAPHWQVLSPSRNRAWGHPALIRFVAALADGIAADGWRGLLIGDLAQPRGGPLPSDHNSHQVGLDADIWLTPLPARRFDGNEREIFEPPSMVNWNDLTIDRQRFGPAQVAMFKRAAEAPEVERIFASPPIKRALCERTTPGAREWLRKIRPWPGHTSHMHVRLACPADSDDCKSQDPPPEGDGCGAELQSWFTDRSWMKEGAKRYEPKTAIRLDALPAKCRHLLAVERDRS